MSNVFRLPDYLDHMLAAAAQACSYVDGMDKVTFFGDKRTQQAVVLNLIVVGEVAARLLHACVLATFKIVATPHAAFCISWLGLQGFYL
jgi:uncharacterized protein with HEPN domain